jgi:hypothetical protein
MLAGLARDRIASKQGELPLLFVAAWEGTGIAFSSSYFGGPRILYILKITSFRHENARLLQTSLLLIWKGKRL